MFVQSNILQTLIPIAEKLKNLDLSDELKEVAELSVTEIKKRLNRGLASDGTVLDTKARNRIGRYSKWHGENRRYAGLRTNVRDLNFTGDMVADFGVTETTNKRSKIGFTSNKEALKAKQNEEYMDDVDVFIPNDKEIVQGKEILNKKINAIINGTR